jgi:probable addiction module antidote protein
MRYRLIVAIERASILIVLLCGGDKGAQAKDIAVALKLAKEVWNDDRNSAVRSGCLPGQPRSDARLSHLDSAFADGDAGEIADALGVVAPARGMSQLAEETGLTRQALYKALSSDGNPEFATVSKVIGALGFRLHPEPASAAWMS